MESSGIGAVTIGSCSGPSMDPKKDSGSAVLTKDQRIEKVEDFRAADDVLSNNWDAVILSTLTTLLYRAAS